MEILKLNKEHKKNFIIIQESTLKNLINPSFFIPVKDNEIESAFTDSKDVVFYGMVDNEILAAVSGLFFDISDLYSEPEMSKINPKETAEIGGCMTLPEFRGKGYMLALNLKLIELARKRGIKYLFATAHPDNIASNKSLMNLGMKKIKEFYRYGKYRRNLFRMEI